MKRVFVDTGGFLAVLVPEDAAHVRARALFSRASVEGWRLTTTNAVMIETYSVLLARARDKRRSALAFLDMLAVDGYAVERIAGSDEDRAIGLLRRHEDKTYSLCDALSFVVMERLGIGEVIAFDRHFREYGRFAVL